MAALLSLLDLRAGMIHKANKHSLSSRNSVTDSRLSGDPLLSTGELALINSKITPRNSNGDAFTPTGPLGSIGAQRRREASTKTMTELRDELSAIDAKAPLIDGLPDGWTPYGLADNLGDTILEATRDSTRLYGITNPGVALLMGIKKAIHQSKLWQDEAALSFKDSTGKYPGTLRIAKGKSNGLAATPAEIRTIIASVSGFGDKIDMTVGKANHYDMFITPNAGAQDHPTRKKYVSMGMMRKTGSSTLAYASPLTGTVFFMDRIRANQEDHNTGKFVNKGTEDSHWSVEIRPNSNDVLEGTIHHEFGHAAASASGLDAPSAVSRKPAPSRYGGKNGHEKFAEYMARYIRTGQVPPWFMDILRSKGLLKSQQN